jgi:hypothetical protein
MIDAANERIQYIYIKFQSFALSGYKKISISATEIDFQEFDISEDELILKGSFGKRPKME